MRSFHKLKVHFKDRRRIQIWNLNSLLKTEFESLLFQLLKAIENQFPQYIRNRFKVCGINTFDPNAVIKNIKQISPSKYFRGTTISPILIKLPGGAKLTKKLEENIYTSGEAFFL